MVCIGICYCFFVFKQKTAYEMRISDWSSDVCSSDLGPAEQPREARADIVVEIVVARLCRGGQRQPRMIVERVAGVEIDHRTERPFVERCFVGLVDHARVEQLGGEDVEIERAIAGGRRAVGRGRDRLHYVDAEARELRTEAAPGDRDGQGVGEGKRVS